LNLVISVLLPMLSAVTVLTFGFLGTELDTAGWCAVASSGRIPQLLMCPQLQMVEDVHTAGTHGRQ